MNNISIISIFVIGIATTLFSVFAVHIFFFRDVRTRFQTVVGTIMAVWAAWCAKDLVLMFPGMYTDGVLQWVMIIDGWSALTYMVFVMEVVAPGWTTYRKLLLFSLPFAFFTAAYALWPVKEVIYGYSLFLWFFAWTVVGVGYVKMRRTMKFVRMEYSDIEKIDVSWLRPVFFFSIAGQLAWLFISFYAEIWVDILYYIFIILLWLMVLYYSWGFQPVRVIADEMADLESLNQTKERKRQPLPPIEREHFERVVVQEQLYLRPDLVLQDLAVALGTNRTYVSAYISQSMGMSFYDYINRLRITRSALPLIDQHPEYTFDYVARHSGFTSMSTFRRAFIKQTGTTPSRYVDKLKICPGAMSVF